MIGRVKNSPKPSASREERAERLAAALRENLKRRKAQARAQQDKAPGAAKEDDKDQAPSR